MKAHRVSLFVLFAMVSGCMQSIQMQDVGRIEDVPKVTYNAYAYSSDGSRPYRAVLLINPESNVEVVPGSIQISHIPGSFESAMHFMQSGGKFTNINIRSVQFKGKPVGYLLTPVPFILAKVYHEVNLYEQDGKIHFSVSETQYTY